MLVVGIDVGGTHTKFGLVENGNIIRSMELGTNTFDIIRQLCNGTREIVQSSNKSWEEVDGVAVGFPGMVIDSVVLDSPNISLQNCNLKEILENELGKLVVVRNDAEMATLAEHKMGAGADCDNMVLITLGTGVGGGIIADKKLYVGAGGAGELGHIVYERNGRHCTCGRKGCAEQYVSMIALDRLAKDIMVGYPNTCVDFNGDGLIYASELIRAYKRNDACAIEIVDKYVEDLTQFMLDLCNLFRPNRIVVGGGITHAPELIDMVARNCRRLEYGYKNSPKVDILSAQLGNQAGILGGYVCVEEELKAHDFEEEYVSEVEEEINSQNENLSLLDSISIRLDKQMNSSSTQSQFDGVVGVDNSSFLEESSGLYVNKALEDISSEINAIKNEQLFYSESDNITNSSSYTNDYGYEQGQSNSYNYSNWDSNTTYDNVANTSNTYNNNNGFENMNNTEESSENDNNTENAFVGVSNEELFSSISQQSEDTDMVESNMEDDDNISLGLNDIFFGAETASLEQAVMVNENSVQDNIVANNEQNNNLENNDQDNALENYVQDNVLENDDEYNSSDEMAGTEVVYDDNLLSRVNAMLNKNN